MFILATAAGIAILPLKIQNIIFTHEMSYL